MYSSKFHLSNPHEIMPLISDTIMQILIEFEYNTIVLLPFLFQAFWYPHLLPWGVEPTPSAISKTVAPINVKFFRDTLESLRNVKVVYIVFT